MPFTFAHAAAALPFRRWCPTYLSFPSLVIGGLTPDMANFLNWDSFMHSFVGSVSMCWLLGMISLWVFLRVRAPLSATLPNPHREALLPLCGKTRSSLFICGISLLLGSWIHIGWDMFTHEHSRLAQDLGSLSVSVPTYGIHQLKVNRVLWVVSTVGGAAAIVAAYLAWLKRVRKPASLLVTAEWRAYAAWLVLAVIPAVPAIALTYLVWRGHSSGFMIRACVEFYLVLLYLTLAIAGFVLLSRPGIQTSGQKVG